MSVTSFKVGLSVRVGGATGSSSAVAQGSSCCSDAASRRLPSAAASAGALPTRAAAPGRASVWRPHSSGGRVPVWRDLRWRGSGRGRRLRAPALRPAPAPPGHPSPQPAAADVQSGSCHVRRSGGRLPGVHRLPRAVLPLLPHGRAALHTAAASHHHDSERF